MADPPREGWSEAHDLLAEKAGYDGGWAAWCAAREVELDRTICGRRTKKDEPCGHGAGERTPHPGQGACYLHGGLSPRGRAHGSYKTGEHAKGWADLYPRSLQEHVQEARDMPEVQWLREMVYMLAGRISRALAEQRDRENPLRPAEFEDVLDDTLEAVQAGDAQRAATGMREMLALARRHREENERWEEIDALAERLQRHVDRLVSVYKDLRVMVHLEYVEDRIVGMAREMREAVEAEVDDPEVVRRVLRRVAVATGDWARQHEQQVTGRELPPGLTGGNGQPKA